MKDLCVQCGSAKEFHRNGFCYHYSDEDIDYYYNDRKFISEEALKGIKYSRNIDGKILIILNETSKDSPTRQTERQ